MIQAYPIYPSPEELLSDKFLNKYKDKQPEWGFNGLGYIVFKRTYARKIEGEDRTEEWWETVKRCILGAQKVGAKYTKEEAEKLYDYVFNLKCNFAGRALWQLNTPTIEKIGGNSLINCFYTKISKPSDFLFLFENSMLGGGVGFSVRREDVHEFPRVKPGVRIENVNKNDAGFIVPDSREGWSELLRKVFKSYFETGKSFTYSTILVRSTGQPIKTFGGVASGPQILIEGVKDICKILSARENKKIRSIDALDICNILGKIVVSGNVRRSAEIALGDVDDIAFLRAKRWDLEKIPNWRRMSNNSVYCSNFDHLLPSFWEGYNGNGEPYGLFNLKLSKKYGRIGEENFDATGDGGNPCQPAWAEVLTKDGIRQFKDINIGDEIWSETGWTKIVNKAMTGVKKVYKYETNAGSFYGTENHRILSLGKKIEVKDSESIDVLSGPDKDENGLYYTQENDFNPQDILDGLVIGDGSVHKANNNLVFLIIGQNDKDYFKSEVAHLIKENYSDNDSFKVETTILNTELPKTYERTIPDRFYFGAIGKKLSFLRGLYSANGSICGERVTLKATSKVLIEQVQVMLSSIGIRSYITTNKPAEITFSNGKYLCKKSYDLNITSDRANFLRNIGFIQLYKLKKLDKIVDETGSGRRKKTYDIKSIEYLGEEEVFDITVDNVPHTYWTGGLNVSNCLEVVALADKETCNLSEIYLNNIEDKETFLECARLLYKYQKAVCYMDYYHSETTEIVHKNMRIGIGVTGICQNDKSIKENWFDFVYREIKKIDKEWSKKNNLNESIRLTTVKPSGTLSLLAGATPGVHPAYSKHYIRRIRMSSNDKLVEYCKEKGFKIEYQKEFDGTQDFSTVVVEFPCFAGEKTVTNKDMGAINQLNLVKEIQKVWADNSVSVTVYYKKEELPQIKEWLGKNYNESIKTVSFLLHSEHGFEQAPYEEISKEKYEELTKSIKPITIFKKDTFDANIESDCDKGACPVR